MKNQCLEFYLVDVFAEKPLAGNQLAVFLDGGSLSGRTMQAIAREMHFSETTFVLSDQPRDTGYDVRIFTPEEEVPFAGHPTLGTAFVIQQAIIRKRIPKIILNLKVGPIPVDFLYRQGRPDILWMEQNPPKFGKTFEPAAIARALGLSRTDLDPRFPVREVSTGLPFVIAPLKTLNAIKKIEVNRTGFLKVLKGAEARCILVFCPQTYSKQNDLNVRMFAPLYGIPEDPATGSANGCLAGYLVKHHYFAKPGIDIRVEQGYEIERPSILYLRARQEAGHIRVRVGGKVFMVSRGTLYR